MRWQNTARCSDGVQHCTMSRQVILCITILPCYSCLPFFTLYLFIDRLDDEGKSQDVEETKREDNEDDNTLIASSIVRTGLPSSPLSSFILESILNVHIAICRRAHNYVSLKGPQIKKTGSVSLKGT